MALLEVKGVDQFYGETHALWGADLEAEEGTCTCIMGRNGVGKTTLLRAIMGLLPIRGGTIRFDGRDLAGRPADIRARLGIGYVPQGREIFPELTVEENLKIGLLVRRDGAREIPDTVLTFFPVLKTMMRRRGGDLSGGQQQQLAIGRALVMGPKLLILDEPTEGIQPNIVREIGDTLVRLYEELGVAVLLVEQKLPFARRVGKRFCIMNRGRTVAVGAMSDLNDDLVQQHLVV